MLPREEHCVRKTIGDYEYHFCLNGEAGDGDDFQGQVTVKQGDDGPVTTLKPGGGRKSFSGTGSGHDYGVLAE